ncbi:MAG: type II toxin-antitoxin system Phd/YefM family antitoxin [Polyangiaceae bacterium]
MKDVSIAEARAHFPRIVHEVEKGKTIEITRRGKPVAVLISYAEIERLRGRKKKNFLEIVREWHRRLPPDFEGFTDEELRSLRDRSPGPPPFEFK